MHVHRYNSTAWLHHKAGVFWNVSTVVVGGVSRQKEPQIHADIWPFSFKYCKIMRNDKHFTSHSIINILKIIIIEKNTMLNESEWLWCKYYSYILPTVDSLLNPKQFHSNVFPHVLKRFVIPWVLGFLGDINWRCTWKFQIYIIMYVESLSTIGSLYTGL